jgi:HTH-type transcriptional regulator/antitoxin HigA
MAKRLSDIWEDKRYFELIREFPLKSIESDKELKTAIAAVNTLIDRGFNKLSPGEDAYLDVLSNLVERYEEEHHPIPDVTAAQILAHLIEARGVSHRKIAAGTRIHETVLSSLLSGRRAFNLNHIKRFSKYFRISPAVFLSK